MNDKELIERRKIMSEELKRLDDLIMKLINVAMYYNVDRVKRYEFTPSDARFIVGILQEYRTQNTRADDMISRKKVIEAIDKAEHFSFSKVGIKELINAIGREK